MKTAGLHLLAFVVTGTLAAQEPAPDRPVKTSARLKEEIRASLPPFTPPPPKVLDQPHDIQTATDPELFALPKLVVKERRLPRDAGDHLMSQRDFKRKMENLYLDTLAQDGPLNVLLNNFTIPIISPPKAARGRAIYEARKYEDIRHVIEVGKLADPKNSTLADEKVDLQQALDRQNRPAGDGRAK